MAGSTGLPWLDSMFSRITGAEPTPIPIPVSGTTYVATGIAPTSVLPYPTQPAEPIPTAKPTPITYVTLGGTRTDPVITPTATPLIPSTEGTSIKDAATGILGDLWDTIKRTGESAVRGALEGGRATSSGAVSGANIGAATAGINFTVLLGFAVVVLLLLKRR